MMQPFGVNRHWRLVYPSAKSGLTADQLSFNIETMGNNSSASIPIAIANALTDKVINRPMWIFAPGFGAGAVAGYAVLRTDPATVALPHGSGQAPTTDYRDQPADQPAPGVGLADRSDNIATALGV